MRYTRKSGTLDAEDTTLAAQLHYAHKTHHSKIITHRHELSTRRPIRASCRRKRTHKCTQTPTPEKPARKWGRKSGRQEGVRRSGVMREIHGLVQMCEKNLNSGAFPQSHTFSSSPQSVVRQELLL
jgi:hypothetical protein